MRDTAIVAAAVLVLFGAAVAVRYWQQPVRRDALPHVELDYRVNVNTADAATLELLPGIGPGIAQHVLDYRADGGRFHKPADLERVPYIGPRHGRATSPMGALRRRRAGPCID